MSKLFWGIMALAFVYIMLALITMIWIGGTLDDLYGGLTMFLGLVAMGVGFAAGLVAILYYGLKYWLSR